MGRVILAAVVGMSVAGTGSSGCLQADLAAPRERGFILAGSVLTACATTIAAALAYPDSAVRPALKARITRALLTHAQRLDMASRR